MRIYIYKVLIIFLLFTLALIIFLFFEIIGYFEFCEKNYYPFFKFMRQLYKLHKDQVLFDRAYAYIKEYYWLNPWT